MGRQIVVTPISFWDIPLKRFYRFSIINQRLVEMSKRKSLANSVPAAAVRQRGKVFSIWTRHKT